MPSRDTVLIERGPEPIHEGQAIVGALRKLLTRAWTCRGVTLAPIAGQSWLMTRI
jgi:hypothetical protein